jgi:hypothetical protein
LANATFDKRGVRRNHNIHAPGVLINALLALCGIDGKGDGLSRIAGICIHIESEAFASATGFESSL